MPHFYLLEPSDGGRMVLKRLAGAEETIPCPEIPESRLSIDDLIEFPDENSILYNISCNYLPVLKVRKTNMVVADSSQLSEEVITKSQQALQRLHLPDDAPKLVAELFCNGEWDQDRLREHFSAWEVREILKIPVAHQGVEDGWTWHFTKNGEFLVRSAYHAELSARRDNRATTSTIPNKTTWSLR
uniref:Uncharacterized protein n=1 Tax=Chenopodium quinoa TaxID=63459 RepID=A0A803LYN7_CHEQI